MRKIFNFVICSMVFVLCSVAIGMVFAFGDRVIGINPVYGGTACIIMLIIHYGEKITFYLRNKDYIEWEDEDDE